MPYILQSTGLVATWIFDRTHHTLFDCGEGVTRTLRRRVFAIERVLLSHGHLDHTAGLLSLIASRASMKGDNEKPLDIYYPAGDRNTEALRACVSQILPNLPYRLSWHQLAPGDILKLTEKRRIECFETKHLPRQTTLGFRITEQRHRLKAEFREDPQIEKRMREMTPEQREAARESYRHTLMAYSGDTMPFDSAEIEGADDFFMDATFLNPEDRQRPSHATLAEAIDLAEAAGAARAWFLHVSTRYTREELRAASQALQERSQGAFSLVWPYATLEV